MQGLYLVTDRGWCGRRSVEEVVEMAVRGGVAYVQLREKELPTRLFVEEAIRIKKLLTSLGVPLIINDRLDVALAVGAEGIHVGQDDIPYEIARKLLGPKAIIGLSVETWEDVKRAQALDCDYLGISPVFATPTKADTKAAWGIEGIARIRAYSRHSLVAIGSLHAGNAADAVRAGADTLAVVSAICAATDPEEASREINGIIRGTLARKKI